MKILSTLALVCVLALAAPKLEATPLPVNGQVVPQALPDPGVVPLLGFISGTFQFGSGPGLVTGTYEQGVLVDPFGLTCAGCLDFFAAVTLDGGLQSGVNALAMGAFRGFTTNVGYGGSGITPAAAHRSQSGSNVDFFFPFLISGIPPGGSSAVVVVATNATLFDQLGFLAISGGRDTSQAVGTIAGVFQPVPEPTTWSLLAVGLAGLGFRLRKQ